MYVTLADGTSDDSGDDNDDLASTGYSPLKAGTDHTDDEDDDAIAELLPATRRTKRPLDTVSEEATVVPKMKKSSDGSRQRTKAGDFDEISKEILVTATSIFRCLIVTQAPFPDGVAVEMRLAKEAWRDACEIKGANVKITPPLVKIVSPPFLVHGWSDLYYIYEALAAHITCAR